MTTNLDKVPSVQHRITALSERSCEVLQQANSSEWPYSALTAEVRLFARELVETANSMLARAGHEIGITVHDCATPLNDGQKMCITEKLTLLADAKKTSTAAVTQVAFACCDCYLDIANTLLTRAQACIRGEQTIAGAKISRGPLWEK